MYKLKKPKQFEVSQNTIKIDFAGTEIECANLLKSGIINQSVVLVGYNEKWHEANTQDLTIAKQIGPTAKDMQYTRVSSNLADFKKHVETHKFTIASIGLIAEEKPDINYMDFFSLSKRFSGYGYLDIEKLYKYMVSEKLPSSKQDVILTMKYISEGKITVNDYIGQTEKQKHEIINGVPSPPKPSYMKTVLSPEELAQRKASRINDLNSLGMIFDEFEGNFEGFGLVVTADQIEEDTNEEWKVMYVRIRNASGLTDDSFVNPDLGEPFEHTETQEPANIDLIPAPEQTLEEAPDERKNARHESVSEPKSNLITLDAIGNMQPDRISELQGLSEKQDAVVKANPFVKVTDAKTLKQAKTAKANLLKASTETEKIETNASKYLNTFKAMIKKIVEPAAKKTRDALKLQADEITAYENAEALRVQAEQKAKLEKIKKRAETLFAVPFVFNGSLYQIGTLYVTPSQVETSTDEEFDVLVKQGEAIKQALESARAAESEKDAMIKELQEKIAALTNTSLAEPNTANQPEQPEQYNGVSSNEAAENISKSFKGVGNPITAHSIQTDIPAPENTSKTESGRVPFKFTPKSEYDLPAPGNKILNSFDMEHIEHVQSTPIPLGFIKSREWLKHGSRLLADEILTIMANPDPNVKKAPLIVDLCTIIKNDV